MVARFSPVFYLIDAVRHGMIGLSDSARWLAFAVVSAVTLAIAWQMFATGYRLKARACPGRIINFCAGTPPLTQGEVPDHVRDRVSPEPRQPPLWRR